jgi:hypothetical protein
VNLESIPSSLSHDQFLYACRQALTARTTKAGFDSHLRHEPFLYGRFYAGRTLSVQAWRDHMQAILSHAYKVSPQFRRAEEINLDTVSFFALAIATLAADMDALLQHFAGIKLLPILGVPREKKDQDKLPGLARLFEKHETHLKKAAAQGGSDEQGLEYEAFPLDAADRGHAEAEVRDRTQVSEELWGVIFGLVRSTFPDHHRAISDFLRWHYQPELPPAAIDWRIRPPVGDAFQQFQRSFQSGARAGSPFGFGGRGGDRGGDRGERGERGDRGSSRGPRPQDRPARPLEAARPESKPEPKAEGRPPQRVRETPGDAESGSSPAALEEARREVEHSIRILEKNSKRPGIRLQPQNSFIRREQHMVAGEKGFATESVGEGRDRAVYIKNKTPT